jgi:prepilin-type N-terminal cleavage/methylation domain-containing protein
MVKNNHLKAFSLIELMLVVVIIGVLSALAMPAYRKYILNSKLSESYTTLDVMGKSQMTFYNENSEFFNIGPPENPLIIQANMVIESDANWERFGYPVAVGNNVFFSYRTWAGKTDGSGTEIINPVLSVTGLGFMEASEPGMSRGQQPSGVACNGSISADTLGVSLEPNYSWAVLHAVGDLNGDQGDLCTAVSRVIVSSAATNNLPGFAGGFILINTGE